MKKVTIFAMTEKGYVVLKSIVSLYPEIVVAVVSASDEGIEEDYYSEILEFCKHRQIPFHDRSAFKTINTEYAIAISWRWIIDIATSRLIVFHDSLLPRYRGFNPLVTALIKGDTKIGVSALYAVADYDCGEIIHQSESGISYPITIQTAIKIIIKNYEELAIRVVEDLAHDIDPTSKPQQEEEASYSLWRDEEDYFIDWTQTAIVIERTINAMGSPYKGAASTIENSIVRIRKAEAVDDVNIANRTTGKVIFIRNGKPIVICGQGLLRIDELTDDSGKTLIPLARFRTRLKGFTTGVDRAITFKLT